jgi:hypothetical protein
MDVVIKVRLMLPRAAPRISTCLNSGGAVHGDIWTLAFTAFSEYGRRMTAACSVDIPFTVKRF